MEGIGPILKRAREEKNISLQEIAETTKIRVKYLQAIEDEQFDLLPGAVYAKGFVNTYIRYLDIGSRPDVQEIMQATPKTVVVPIVQEETVEKVESRRHALEDKPITSKKPVILGISVVAILALLAVQIIYSKQQPPDNDDLQLPPSSQLADDTDQNPPDDTQNNPDDIVDKTSDSEQQQPSNDIYTGLNLQVQIIDLSPSAVDKCWMSISADGTNVLTETLNEGAVKTITAENTIRIKAGNSGVCQLTLNGQDLGVMGEKGQVVERTFTLEDVQNISQATNRSNAVSSSQN